MHVRICLLCTLILLATNRATVAQKPTTPATGNTNSALSFVPDSAVAYVHLSVNATLSEPSLKMYPTEIMTAAGEEELGFDPVQIDSIDIAIGIPGPGVPQVGARITTKVPVEVTQLSPRFVDVDNPESIKGKEFYSLVQAPGMVLHPVDSQTFFVGSVPFIQLMLATPHEPSNLTKFAKSVNADQSNALAVIDIKSIYPIIEMGMSQGAEQLPPEVLESITGLLESTDILAIRGTAATQTLQVLCQGTDEAAAKKIESSINDLFTYGKEMLAEQLPMHMESKVEQATKAYFERMTGEMMTMLSPKRTSNRVMMQLSMQNQNSFVTAGLLAGLILPAIQTARMSATTMTTSNDIRQLGLAMLNYEQAYKKLPDDIKDADGNPILSWRVQLLPFLDEQQLYSEFHLDEPWNSPHNSELVHRMPSVYGNMSMPLQIGHTPYLAPWGDGLGVLGLGLAEITDGTSNTIAIVEAPPEYSVTWSEPADFDVDREAPHAPWVSSGMIQFNAVMVDVTVKSLFISELEPETFLGMLTPHGGEVISDF
jgi:hypothetical protein